MDLLNIEPSLKSKRKRRLRELRKLGGEWKAVRFGFNWWEYEGELRGHRYEIRSHSYLAPQYDGDDSSTLSLWTVTCDGQDVGFPVRDPVALLRRHLWG